MKAVFVQRIIRRLGLGIILTLPALCEGQSSRPLSVGGVSIPVATGILGKQDPAALSELTAHRAAVTGTKWGGMQATGTMTFGTQDSTSYPATLSNMDVDMFRLDVQEQSGPTSIRIHGPLGKVQSADGVTTTMPPGTALAGIFSFERLRRSNLSSPNTSFTDQGMVTVGGAQLHRITLEYGALGHNPATHSRATIATDLYFDPTTHLLAQSATLEAAPSGRQASFLIVVTYGDYRTVGKSLIPFRYTETIEGQPYSTLQLSSVQLDPTLTPAYFEF